MEIVKKKFSVRDILSYHMQKKSLKNNTSDKFGFTLTYECLHVIKISINFRNKTYSNFKFQFIFKS